MTAKALSHLTLAVLCTCWFTQCSTAPQADVMNVSLGRPCQEQMPHGFVYVDQVAPLVKTDLRYAGHDNFIGRPFDGYKGKRAILRKETARQLKAASEYFAARGYLILVYDAYRPHTAMVDINTWAQDTADQKMKARYYPNLEKEKIFKDLYLRNISEHSRGSAVDITLLHAKNGKPVDMGGRFDLMDPTSATDSKQITVAQQNNRRFLKQGMKKHGFDNYAPEWWHYRLANEPDMESYFLFPVCDNMKPIGQQ